MARLSRWVCTSIMIDIPGSLAYFQIEPRQVGDRPGSGFANMFPPVQKAFKIEDIKATFPGAKRVKLIYWPYKLKAANVCS